MIGLRSATRIQRKFNGLSHEVMSSLVCTESVSSPVTETILNYSVARPFFTFFDRLIQSISNYP